MFIYNMKAEKGRLSAVQPQLLITYTSGDSLHVHK